MPWQYSFRKRPLPADDDDNGKAELAQKLAKYSLPYPEYVAAFEDGNHPW